MRGATPGLFTQFDQFCPGRRLKKELRLGTQEDVWREITALRDAVFDLISYSGTPLRDRDGNITLAVITLHDVTDGICQPTDLNDGRKGTWCFAQTPFKIAKSTAEVDLYFLGGEKTAPLIELQLKVRGCHEDEVEQWMRSAFGVPIENKANRVYWKNSFLWAAALLPSEPGRCVVYFLPIADNGAIALVKQL